MQDLPRNARGHRLLASDPLAGVRSVKEKNPKAPAEQRAELPKLDGSSWHAYRQAWASSRKHLPLADVAAAGGWKGARTLLGIYQQADMGTMLAVMSEPRKVTERAVGT